MRMATSCWRNKLGTLAGSLGACAISLSGISFAHAFSIDDVIHQARQLAAKPYEQPDESALPKVLATLSHSEYEQIRFKRDDDLWANTTLKFRVGFMIRGGAYRTRVKINEVDSTGIHPIEFHAGQFDFGDSHVRRQQIKKVGFSGLRIRFPINNLRSFDPVLGFHGASYFKALGKGQVPGVTARGLAIDTGLLSGEQFPHFVEFWVERPAMGDKAMVIDALMDSKNVTGAYRFALHPGTDTAVGVQAHIFLRDYVSKLGLAPLASMYLYGANQPNRSRDDYRPQVHASDGLQIASGTGEWIWRPLVDPKRLLITSFSMVNPQGFGLMQRDRDFSDYQDLRHRYDLMPSVWVRPQGNWGSGRIELVEIPSPDETDDNIVAFWIPDNVPKPLQPINFSYRITWQMQHPTNPPNSWVTQTRRGNDSTEENKKGIGFLVDFEGPALTKLPDNAPVRAVVTSGGNGAILAQSVVHNDVTGGWRLHLSLHRIDDGKPVELRAYLKDGQNTISETWSYILPPS